MLIDVETSGVYFKESYSYRFRLLEKGLLTTKNMFLACVFPVEANYCSFSADLNFFKLFSIFLNYDAYGISVKFRIIWCLALETACLP